jgi:hypothetical protein
VRQDIGDLLARLAVLAELELRPQAAQLLPLQLSDRLPLVNDSGIGWPSISASFGL